MLLTVALALECEAICTLAEHRLASGLTASEAGVYVDGLIGTAEPVRAFFRWRPSFAILASQARIEHNSRTPNALSS
jgi:hypothetical protein